MKNTESKTETFDENDVKGFNGNPLLKRAGEKIAYTKEQILEIKKCMEDPIYFAEHYIKVVHVDKGLITIKLYDYQKNIIKALQENRYNILLSCRQSGKCLSLNTIITVKHPDYKNGKPFTITIGDFYTWQYFKRLCREHGVK